MIFNSRKNFIAIPIRFSHRHTSQGFNLENFSPLSGCRCFHRTAYLKLIEAHQSFRIFEIIPHEIERDFHLLGQSFLGKYKGTRAKQLKKPVVVSETGVNLSMQRENKTNFADKSATNLTQEGKLGNQANLVEQNAQGFAGKDKKAGGAKAKGGKNGKGGGKAKGKKNGKGGGKAKGKKNGKAGGKAKGKKTGKAGGKVVGIDNKEGNTTSEGEENAEGSGGAEGDTDGSSFQKEGLAAHNVFRKIHGTSALKLDPGMSKEAEAYAQLIAKEGKLFHSSTKDGENLAMGCNSKNLEVSAAEAVKDWCVVLDMLHRPFASIMPIN